MRHLGSIVLSLLVAPLVYALIGVGLMKFPQAVVAADRDLPDYRATVAALGAPVVAGLLYAVLTLIRPSPLGPLLAGLAFLGVGLWPLLSLDTFHRTMPRDLLGVGHAGYEPAGAVSLLLAIPLLAAAVTHRWRRYGRPPVAAASPDVAEAVRPDVPSGYPATPDHPPTLGRPSAPEPRPGSEGDPSGEERTRRLPQPPPTYPPDPDATRRL